ncbi:hypothetical protein L1987_07060 [Smallanthus sonchifolius]|uniref:Uncharacterized protein n=1 Tax=Smallanthus sonchifolius TaxID=185202 RepID=A0ACB9JZU6_9ASTR|nr:hypothetical protein L1987_07060 [Smallanthus sonchifolius]
MRQKPGKNISISLDVIDFVLNKRVTTTRNIENVPFKIDEQDMLAFFKKHDVNKDKRLSWDELKQAFSELGVSWVRWTTDRALVNADTDEDGYIDENEMDKLIQFALKLKLKTKK